jgi:DNA-binding response OmpR family regulator
VDQRKEHEAMATARLCLSAAAAQPVQVSQIHWNAERRCVRIGRTVIRLTETEYRVLFALRSGEPVTYAQMAWQVYQYRQVDLKMRLTMDKHIDRTRGKLRGTGIYIYCVLGYGYLLLPELCAEEEA